MRLHYVYLLQCADGTLYCGYTTDLKRRVDAHNGVVAGGARYTRTRRPVILVYHESHPTQSAAKQREAAIKQLSRPEKDALRQLF